MDANPNLVTFFRNKCHSHARLLMANEITYSIIYIELKEL